jgi:hypothetical protein
MKILERYETNKIIRIYETRKRMERSLSKNQKSFEMIFEMRNKGLRTMSERIMKIYLLDDEAEEVRLEEYLTHLERVN